MDSRNLKFQRSRRACEVAFLLVILLTRAFPSMLRSTGYIPYGIGSYSAHLSFNFNCFTACQQSRYSSCGTNSFTCQDAPVPAAEKAALLAFGFNVSSLPRWGTGDPCDSSSSAGVWSGLSCSGTSPNHVTYVKFRFASESPSIAPAGRTRVWDPNAAASAGRGCERYRGVVPASARRVG